MIITYEEKAFYDILKWIAHKFGFEYSGDKWLVMAAAVKKMMDNKTKYTDWANRSYIRDCRLMFPVCTKR